MKVMYITPECKPFSKVGGLADVAGELPPALKRLGVDVEVVTPLYSSVDRKQIAASVFPRTLSLTRKKKRFRFTRDD
jgi:glycogen synthase